MGVGFLEDRKSHESYNGGVGEKMAGEQQETNLKGASSLRCVS